MPSPACSSKPTRAPTVPVKATFLVAEELGFDQRLGDGAAGDGNKGMAAAVAEAVDGAGNEFFSGTAFAGDEHGGVDVGDAAHEVIDLLHCGRWNRSCGRSWRRLPSALLRQLEFPPEGGVLVGAAEHCLEVADGGRSAQ